MCFVGPEELIWTLRQKKLAILQFPLFIGV